MNMRTDSVLQVAPLKKILFVIVLTSLIFTLTACGEDYTFEQQYHDASKKAETLLVQHNICIPKNTCAGKIFFAGPLHGGMEIKLYGVNDKNIQQLFIEVFVQKFIETSEMQHLIIDVYPLPHEEYLDKPLWEEKSIFNIDMRR